LDDLMSALRTNRSRCLFGSGIAEGKDRAARALRNALASPLLDQGALLKDAQTVLVHLSGGEDLTLYEIELLMQRLQKFVPEKAHVLFGAAIDPAMKDSLSVTLISALPEDHLRSAPREALTPANRQDEEMLAPSHGFEAIVKPEPISVPVSRPQVKIVEPVATAPEPKPVLTPPPLPEPEAVVYQSAPKEETHAPSFFDEPPFAETVGESAAPEPISEWKSEEEEELDQDDFVDDEPFTFVAPEPNAPPSAPTEAQAPAFQEGAIKLIPEVLIPSAPEKPRWGAVKSSGATRPMDEFPPDLEEESETHATPEPPKLKLGIKTPVNQSELSFDSAPRGRFEGVSPNVVNGEDLDLPPFLRKKK
jgi:hypothetical protein